MNIPDTCPLQQWPALPINGAKYSISARKKWTLFCGDRNIIFKGAKSMRESWFPYLPINDKLSWCPCNLWPASLSSVGNYRMASYRDQFCFHSSTTVILVVIISPNVLSYIPWGFLSKTSSRLKFGNPFHKSLQDDVQHICITRKKNSVVFFLEKYADLHQISAHKTATVPCHFSQP